MQPVPLKNRILHLCAARLSIQIPVAPASLEQRGAYRSTSASTVRRQLAAPDAALAACWTAHQLRVGRADVQDSSDVISAVPEPAHLVAHQRTQHRPSATARPRIHLWHLQSCLCIRDRSHLSPTKSSVIQRIDPSYRRLSPTIIIISRRCYHCLYFYAWSNLWRHQLLSLKLRCGPHLLLLWHSNLT